MARLARKLFLAALPLAVLYGGSRLLSITASEATPAGPGAPRTTLQERAVPRQGWLLGPVEGLTTAWHPVPAATAVPRGTTLRFKLEVPAGASFTWDGADEVAWDGTWSTAECHLDTLGTHSVQVEMVAPDGSRQRGRSLLEVVDTRVEEIRVSLPALSVEPFTVDESSPNAQTYQAFRGGSIARLREVSPYHYVTSTGRPVDLEAAVEPAGFAPLMEWRLAGAEPAVELGSSTTVTYWRRGKHRISVGPLHHPQRLYLVAYSTEITSHTTGRDDVHDGVTTTFTAVTHPPGFEDGITWLASTKYGRGTPVTGEGPVFQVAFEGTFGPDRLPGRLFQWLGVRADDATFDQDAKAEEDWFSSTGRAAVTLDVNDVDCSQGIQLDLTSAGLENAAVRLDPPPYSTGIDIDTELIRLELGAFDPLVGNVVIRERPDRASPGRITGVVATGGSFQRGDSFFDVFVEVELTDLGAVLHTGETPVRLEAEGITSLPPIGSGYVPPPSQDPVPLYYPFSPQQVGWLCHGEHVPEREERCDDPPTEEDWFTSTGEATVTLDPEDTECEAGLDLALSSQGLQATTVVLDRPPYQSGVDIETELVRLELGGVAPEVGEIIISERPDRASRGRIENVEADGVGRFVSGDSFFDIFVDVAIPSLDLQLHTGASTLRLEAGQITELPPLSRDYLPPQDAPPVPLYDARTFEHVGWLCHGRHTPEEEVPCDTQGCGVIASGPRLLCVGDTVTFTAAGAPAGGSYRWEVIAGGERAAIVGPANRPQVTVRGTQASAAHGDVTLRVTYTVGGRSCAVQISFTVMDVTQVEWIGVDGGDGQTNLEDTTLHGGGKRLFPGRNEPGGPTHRRVKARVTLNLPVPGEETLTVYLEAFDVDDPTRNGDDPGPMDNPVDANDTATAFVPGDNRPQDASGNGPLGIQPAGVIARAIAGGGQTAEVEYEVTHLNPGNNWKVFATCSRQEIDDVEVNPTVQNGTDAANSFRRTSNPAVIPAIQHQSPLLSLWRKLHLELDSMTNGTDNPFTGNIDDVDNADAPHAGEGAAELNDWGDEDDGRWEGGRLVVLVPGATPNVYEVIDNLDDPDFLAADDNAITSTPVAAADEDRTATLTDDDATTHLEREVDTGLAEDKFQPAYILPVEETAASDLTNIYRPEVAFTNSAIDVVVSQNQDLSHQAEYWLAHVVTAHQGKIDGDSVDDSVIKSSADLDPDNRYHRHPASFKVGDQRALYGVTHSAGGNSLIYIETIREVFQPDNRRINRNAASATTLEQITVVHEVGHSFGLGHEGGAGSIMNGNGLMHSRSVFLDGDVGQLRDAAGGDLGDGRIKN